MAQRHLALSDLSTIKWILVGYLRGSKRFFVVGIDLLTDIFRKVVAKRGTGAKWR
jgi:hypothetical protein